MPHSQTDHDEALVAYVQKHHPKAHILDVGPGSGKYGWLLRDTHQIDALEIHEPYLKEFDLPYIYQEVILGDVRTYPKQGWDLAIMGDVLEHLTVEEAKATLKSFTYPVLIVVPWLYKQNAFGGNEHEDHKQEDLTRRVMRARYPVGEVCSNERGGLFLYEGSATPEQWQEPCDSWTLL